VSLLSGSERSLPRARPVAPMPPVAPGDYGSPSVRRAIERVRAERRTRYRGRWWFPPFVVLCLLSVFWGLLKTDQLVAEKLIWPSSGAQFVEVGPLPADPAGTGSRMMIVVGGLNRKSGTGTAAALMPSLTVGHTRVFSLIYGSGINDQDILDKFDALMATYRPREVSFFGSSMGGDVVLNLAAHAQQRRDDYRQQLIADPQLAAAGAEPGNAVETGSGPTRSGAANSGAADSGAADSGAADSGAADSGAARRAEQGSAPPAQRDRIVGAQAARISGLLVTQDSAASARVGTMGVRALIAPPAAIALPAGTTRPATTAAAIDPPPRLGTIYLDCSPLGADDVRDADRTQADALTGLTEALHTDGGVAVRMSAEVLAQQRQWSTGRFPFLDVRPDELLFKINQVWREKIGAPGISTQLIKDQYGVIRRTDIDDIVDALGPGARIVYFLPENRTDDRTVRVEQVETELDTLAADNNLDLRVVAIPGGHHASAESNSDLYRRAIDSMNGGGS